MSGPHSGSGGIAERQGGITRRSRQADRLSCEMSRIRGQEIHYPRLETTLLIRDALAYVTPLAVGAYFFSSPNRRLSMVVMFSRSPLRSIPQPVSVFFRLMTSVLLTFVPSTVTVMRWTT
jgi:hypothetical protein